MNGRRRENGKRLGLVRSRETVPSACLSSNGRGQGCIHEQKRKGNRHPSHDVGIRPGEQRFGRARAFLEDAEDGIGTGPLTTERQTPGWVGMESR